VSGSAVCLLGQSRPARPLSPLALAGACCCEYKRGVGRVPPREASGIAQLELRLAGVFGVVRGGVPLPDGELGSRKARTLLKLLAVERAKLVSVDRIAEVLWAGNPPKEPTQHVATLVSRLRRVLGSDAIHGGRQGYQLASGPGVVIDLDEAAQLTGHAERELARAPALACSAAGRAVQLLSPGIALAEEPYAAWAEPARQELSGLLRRARHVLAGAAQATGDADLAARVAGDAMADDPFDEGAHRLFMSACAAGGERAKALEAYARLRSRLAEELGTDPAPDTHELYLAILRQQRPSDLGQPADGPARPAARHSGIRHLSRALDSTAPSADLVGRDRELAELTAAWEKAAGGEPGVVLVVGEAGIGKTRLAKALAAEAASAGAMVLQSRCYETERSLFLQPVVEAVVPAVTGLPAAKLRQLLGDDAPPFAALVPEAALLLGPMPPEQIAVDMQRRRAFHSVLAFLRELAARSPVLLMLDDLQYAGQSTVEFVHYLGRHAGGARLLVIATVRAENDAEVGTALAAVASRVEVGPLGADAVGQLASQAGRADLADRILRQTRGHTFFVVEVLQALADGGSGLPESLRSAVQVRARRLGAAAEQQLRVAAVLGAAVDPATVAGIADVAPAAVLHHCELALQARLLVATGRDFEFANDLIREALYATTSEPTRLAYHQRAADLLTGQPESLARHAAACGDWLRAARALLSAADEAFRRFAVTDSAALATQALKAAERAGAPEVGARARVIRGRAHEAMAAFPAALADFSEGAAVARAVGDRRLEMLALRQLGGDVPVAHGMPIGYCESHLVEGLRLAELLGDQAAAADLLARLAIIATNRLQFDLALDYGQRAATAGRAASDGQALAAGLDGLKTVHAYLGHTAALATVLDELDPLLRRQGDLYLLQHAVFESAYVLMAAGDWDQAIAAMESAMEINRRSGWPQWSAWYLACLGWLARLRGHDDEAVSLGRRALHLNEANSHPWNCALACAELGTTLLAAGNREEAIGLFERGYATAENDGAEAYLLRCLAPLAEATRSPAVLAEAGRLLDSVRLPPGDAWVLGYEVYLSVARAWLAAGQPERARAVLAPLLAAVEREPWVAALAAALVVDGEALGRLGQRVGARAALDRGTGLAREHGLAHVLREASAVANLVR
jgi:DNA-binding SARP family transcriptional activator/tetratricopeptide (TPR) repeat protein